MRKFVFRGKTPQKSYKGSRWIFGDLLHTDVTNKDCVAIQYWDEEDGWMTEEVNEFTVGESTGFYDKNGQMIFEGDVLKCDNKKFDQILFFVGYRFGLYEIRPNNMILGSTPLKYHITDEGTMLNGWTIIGNIHDSSELMKGGEK